MCACADVLNFKYRDLKMFLLKLGSEFQNVIKNSYQFRGYKQNKHYISTKWNAHSLTIIL